jgi:hypothetical protein
MVEVFLKFDSAIEASEALARLAGGVPVFPVDDRGARAEPAEAVEVPNAPAAEPSNPAPKPAAAKKKKATKGAADKKNEAQARAAAKLKAEKQAAEEIGDMFEAENPPVVTAATKGDVDAALRAYAQKYQLVGARALLGKFGAARASDLKESQYADFLAAAAKGPEA